MLNFKGLFFHLNLLKAWTSKMMFDIIGIMIYHRIFVLGLVLIILIQTFWRTQFH